MTIREMIGRVRAWLRRDSLDRELASDVQAHLDAVAREFESRGMSRGDAESAARRQIGNVTSLREQSRDAWGFPAIESVMQDVRFAMRGLKRSPAFTITIVATIALGVGAATAMFTIVNGVLLRPLPYRDPASLVTIYTVFPQFKGRPTVGEIWNVLRSPYPDYVRYRDAQQQLAAVGAFNIGTMPVTIGDETTRLPTAQGTTNLLSTLGVNVERGRWFLPGEEGQGSPKLAVLSHSMWRSRFGGDEGIVGRTVTLAEGQYEIVGVLPESFALGGKVVGTRVTVQPEVWIPVGADGRGFEAGNHTLEIVGRLKTGASIDAASAEAEPLLRGTASPERRTSRMISRIDDEVNEVRQPLLLLLGAVTLFLAVACGNVAVLFLGECATRADELRTRQALGAGRSRLIRLLLTESGVLAAAGAVVGAAIAWIGTRVLLALAPTELPHSGQITVDLRVLLFTIGIAGLVTLACGLAPVLLFTDGSSLRQRGGNRVTAGRSRIQFAAIGLQAAGAIMLLVSAGLLGRSFMNESAVNPGFTPGEALEMRVSLPRSRTPTPDDTRRLYGEVARALGELPGAVTVTAMSTPPLSGRTNGQAVRPMPIDDPTQPAVNVGNAVVLPNYFDAMEVALLAGRPFAETDTAGAPLVAVINEAMARRFWNTESAIGKEFKHPNGVATIVGVVADVRQIALSRAAEPMFYLPSGQSSTELTFIMHTRDDAASAAPGARRAIWGTVPGASISEVTTTAALHHRALAPTRYRAALASTFAGLAVLLTVVGVAGITARGVSAGMRELCIRMALGATATSTMMLALRRSFGAAAAGTVLGALLTPFTTRWLAAYLYEVHNSQVATYAIAIVLSIGACLVAGLVAARPVRRASLATTLREQ